jgi:hypothetical protein
MLKGHDDRFEVARGMGGETEPDKLETPTVKIGVSLVMLPTVKVEAAAGEEVGPGDAKSVVRGSVVESIVIRVNEDESLVLLSEVAPLLVSPEVLLAAPPVLLAPPPAPPALLAAPLDEDAEFEEVENVPSEQGVTATMASIA